MTKKTLQLLASVALVAGLGMTTVTANAAGTTSSGSVGTTAKVQLDSNGAGDNGDGDGGNVAGSLAITSAPDVDFGTGTIDGKTATILKDKALSQGEESHDKAAAAGAVTVVDPGTASGWRVQVSSKPLTSTIGGTGAAAAILGGTFTYDNGVVAGGVTNTKTEVVENPATQDATSLKFNSEGTDNQNVYHAATGSGVGTWTNTYKSASMTIPAGNAAGSYSADLTWTLTNSPE
ncbi:WxL domain-containing protein [Levilactobacillus yiduensis]|uniref:WxL domain-containing protein n=1 Tax=Levilactobacillus yiduensis TaxID=2953880 RepID=UPI000EF2987D|nr:WxL domain-containing protein [Levilactobacillus yiduensis]AYM03905.1 hypothetical protein D8911_13300 [Levilactobacillus brevis]